MIEPPLAPPWKGGGHAALLHRGAFSRSSFPLCKGELEGVVPHYNPKGAAEATPFPYRPERFRSHRFLHQATTTELITPPTILNTPVTKSSATCERKALNPSVKNIPVKKYTLIIPSNSDYPTQHSRSSRLRNNTPSR